MLSGINAAAKKKAILNFYKNGSFSTVTKGAMKTPLYSGTVLDMADNVFSPWAVMDSHMFKLLGMSVENATEESYRYERGYGTSI